MLVLEAFRPPPTDGGIAFVFVKHFNELQADALDKGTEHGRSYKKHVMPPLAKS